MDCLFEFGQDCTHFGLALVQCFAHEGQLRFEVCLSFILLLKLRVHFLQLAILHSSSLLTIHSSNTNRLALQSENAINRLRGLS